MAPISPIPHQTHLEINKNRGPKSLPFAVLNLSCLELHSVNGYKIFTFWASKAPILLFVCSNPSRARHKEWFQASSKVTRLTCLVAKRSICGWKMFWSWSSMMKPLATWVTWQVRHEQISFFAASFSPMGKALRKVFEEQPTRRFWPPHHLVDSAWKRRKENDGYPGKCDENG